MEECFKTSAILNMSLSLIFNKYLEDSEAVNLYENDGTIMLLEHLFKEEETFSDVIIHAGPQKISLLYDKINRII